MQAELCVDQDASELRSLHAWLRGDADIRRSVGLELREAPPRPEQMGSLVDVLQLVTDNSWSAASFVMALVAWKRTRPQNPNITINHGDTSVTLTNCSDEEVERVIRFLNQQPTGEAADQ